eukprot:scaffold104089_cov64-Phaeocystis_antarctica.AAC.4
METTTWTESSRLTTYLSCCSIFPHTAPSASRQGRSHCLCTPTSRRATRVCETFVEEAFKPPHPSCFHDMLSRCVCLVFISRERHRLSSRARDWALELDPTATPRCTDGFN